MSIKIYDGLRFISSDLLTVHQQMMEWREEVRQLTRNAEAAFIAKRCVHDIDTLAMFDRHPLDVHDNVLSHHVSEFLDEQLKMKKDGRRRPNVDFEFTVTVMPFEGRLYGIPNVEQREWLTLFMERGIVEEFGYWNNTDRPDELTDEEWEERERIWEGILEGDWRPSSKGFITDCTTSTTWPSVDHVLPACPTFEERCRNMAKDVVFKAKVPEYQPPVGSKNRSSFSWISEIMSYIASPEGKAEVELAMVQCREKLAPEITASLLLGEKKAAKLGY